MPEQNPVNRNNTAVLIMDYQNRQLSTFSEEFRNEILARANAVLAKARAVGVPVVYVEVRRGERTPETEIHSAIKPLPGEPVFTKRAFGPFSTTNLDEELKRKGIENLIVMGISTGGCVLSTVRWGAEMGYKLTVLADCCADPDEEVHRVLVGKVIPRQATVITAEEFMRSLEPIA